MAVPFRIRPFGRLGDTEWRAGAARDGRASAVQWVGSDLGESGSMIGAVRRARLRE